MQIMRCVAIHVKLFILPYDFASVFRSLCSDSLLTSMKNAVHNPTHCFAQYAKRKTCENEN